MSNKKRSLPVLPCLVLPIAVPLAAMGVKNAAANVRAMNRAVDLFVEKVGAAYPIKELDCGEYSTVKLYGVMKFRVRQYAVEDIGNLAVMTVNMGLMQMATVVLTPVEKDMPLVSMDYIYALNNRTAYLEVYDLVLEPDGEYRDLLGELAAIKESFGSLETVTPASAWYDSLKTQCFYKKASAKDDMTLIDMLDKALEPILAYGKELPRLDADRRAEKAALQKTYSNGLIEHGGVSTDAFVKALGTEKTRDFFDRVLFKAE